MLDNSSGRSCPTICSVASSKEVCAKRLCGWGLLLIIVGSIALGIAIVINSRNQRFKDEAYEIDIAVGIWNDRYKNETKSWSPSVINSDSEEFQISESNDPDFSGRYRSLNTYDVVKYFSDDIKNIVSNQTQRVIQNSENGEFNLTTPITIDFSAGGSLAINNIPFYSKTRSARSSKDWTLNHIGIWNNSDGYCYVFKQLTNLCLTIDHDNFPNLIENYTAFPCDEINRSYASFALYKWTDANSNPSFSNFSSSHQMTFTIRSSKDPYVVGYTTLDIMKDKEDNVSLSIFVYLSNFFILNNLTHKYRKCWFGDLSLVLPAYSFW